MWSSRRIGSRRIGSRRIEDTPSTGLLSLHQVELKRFSTVQQGHSNCFFSPQCSVAGGLAQSPSGAAEYLLRISAAIPILSMVLSCTQVVARPHQHSELNSQSDCSLDWWHHQHMHTRTAPPITFMNNFAVAVKRGDEAELLCRMLAECTTGRRGWMHCGCSIFCSSVEHG